MASSLSPSVHQIMTLYAGQSVPFHFSWGFVALSYLVSLIGAGSTLELINRRTSIKGRYNHVLLFGAAISMGGIAIWSMHYIANRAIVILDNQEELQIAYSPGITAASFFVPILVLILAFLAVSTTNDGVVWWRLVLAGTLSGSAICGMHYLGNASIRNYRCVYAAANVIGAAIIAVSASTVALALFFVFRVAWSVSWPRRVGCMAVLAGAVSGMHWCAALGTSYTLRDEARNQGGPGDSRTSTVVVVIFLAVAAAATMLLAAVLTARTMRRYASKAQQITLAAAVFDGHGRILVSPDGLLPSERVTETFPQRSHDDVFSLAHPLFHWMYRASRNWSSVAALLPWMVAHLDALPQYHHHHHHHHRSKTPLFQENGQLVEGYDVIFRELFCLAASTLASRMAEDVVNMGTLWDEIFHTGTEARPGTRMSATLDAAVADAAAAKGGRSDDEASHLERGTARLDTYGQGCLMFLVRHVNSTAAVAKLEAAGFRFADTHRVVDIIKSSMQIKSQRLEATLREMAAHTNGLEGLVVPGLHVGLFAVRARLDKFGFDVVVDATTRSTLPSRAMPYRTLENEQREVLMRLSGLPLQSLLLRLAGFQDASPRQVEFAGYLRAALARLRADLDDDPALDGATLAPAVVQVPCLQRPNGGRADDGPAATASLITLQLVLDINARFRCPRATFVPLQFLKVHQLVADNAPHHGAFSRALHREMSAVMAVLPPSLPAKKKTRSTKSIRPTSQSSSTRKLKDAAAADEDYPPVSHHHHHHGFPPACHTSRCDDDDDISNDSRGATLAPPPSRDLGQSAKPSLFGGIMVSNEIAIQVDEVKPPSLEISSSGGSCHRAPHHYGDDRGEVGLAGRLRASWARPAALRPAGTRLRRNSRPSTATGIGTAASSSPPSHQHQHQQPPLPLPPPPSAGVPIELTLRSPTTAALYGASVGGAGGTGIGINVAAQEKEADVPTYIDDLFAACMEKRM